MLRERPPDSRTSPVELPMPKLHRSRPARVFFIPLEDFPLYYLPRSQKVVSLAVAPSPDDDDAPDDTSSPARNDCQSGDPSDGI